MEKERRFLVIEEKIDVRAMMVGMAGFRGHEWHARFSNSSGLPTTTTRPTTSSHFYISNFETRKWKENEEYSGLRHTLRLYYYVLTSALALDDRR